MTAIFKPTQPISSNIPNVGITDQSNNITTFDFDLGKAFPDGYQRDYTYFVGYYLTTTQPNSNNFMGYYVPTSGKGIVWGQYDGSMKSMETFDENIPAQSGPQTIWYAFDFSSKNCSIGVNSPIGANGVTVKIPGPFHNIDSFSLPSIVVGRFKGNSIQKALETYYNRNTGFEWSKVPVTNVYIGNFL